MSCTSKIKGLLSMYGKTFADYARKLGILPQSLSTKAKSNAYKIEDLILLADLTNTRLAFLDDNNEPVLIFNNNDLGEK